MEEPIPRQPPRTEPSASGERLEERRGSAPSGVRILALLTIVLAGTLVVVGVWAAYWAGLRNDQYQLIHLGQCVQGGGRMYVDCWENKPPGIAWINALGLFAGRGVQLGAWLLPGVAAVSCLGVLGLAVRQLLSPVAACFTVLLAAIVTTIRLYDAASVNPDTYASLFALAAVSCWLVGLVAPRRGRRAWLGLLAGLAWAASASVKQTGVAGLLVVSIVAIVMTALNRGEYRSWLVASVWAWIGFAVGAVAVGGVLYHRGTLAPAWEAIFEFNRGLINPESIAGTIWSGPRVQAALLPVQLPLWLALVGGVAALRANNALRFHSAVACAMLLWWLTEVVLALEGPSGSMRYWQATFPPMLWLAGAGIHCLETSFNRLGRGHRSALAIALLTIVVVLGRPLFDGYAHGLSTSYLTYRSDDRQRDRLAAIGAKVRASVPEGESIYAWAYDAGIYVHSARSCASRFTYPRSAGQMRRILSDVGAGGAYALLIPERSSPEFGRWCDDACYRRLVETVAAYELTETIHGYQLWLRRDGGAGASGPLPDGGSR